MTSRKEPGLRELPMFPLGSVLLPSTSLRLHVFEPRYRALVEDVLETDREFGVVLIERGSEVGGGETRTGIGTVARVAQQLELPDGRWMLACAGRHRFRVERWLEDDPYPRAEVVELADGRADDEDLRRYEALAPRVRRILALRSELGEPAPPATVAFPTDPVSGTFVMATLAALGPVDKQRLLGAGDVTERLDVLDDVLTALTETLTFRIAGGPRSGDDDHHDLGG